MSQDNNQNQQNQQEQQPPATTDAGTFAKDSQGKVNVSRGIIGLVSNPNAPTITEGTVADKVNQPSRFPNADGKINPVTAEDLENRIKLERSRAGMDKDRQEQIVIKARTEAQGFKYSPPEEFKDDPELAATQDNFQQGESTVNENQGEQIIDVDGQSQSVDNIKG